jgi:kynurenine formamidase
VRSFVDLSAPLEPSAPEVPAELRVEVTYWSHDEGAALIERSFGVPRELLRDGEGWASERVALVTHSTTHVDAPYHYNSTIAGQPAQTIDQLPLEWFFGPGVVVDFHERGDGERISASDMRDTLAHAEHELAPGDIVLVRTDCDRFYGQADYPMHGPGVTAEATRWLFDQGVRVMGIDAWGWDRPLSIQAAEARARGETGIFWEAHQCDLPFSQIERLANLAALPNHGFEVACFPLRIIGGSAAPARVVAILPG